MTDAKSGQLIGNYLRYTKANVTTPKRMVATIPSSVDLKQFSWKIGAPAGFGVMTTGLLMAKLATRSGAHVACYAEYPSLIQGGHNTYELTVKFSSHPYATKKIIDCLVCLNTETYALHLKRLSATSLVIFDPSLKLKITTGVAVPIPLAELQAGLKADKIMINTIALGASAALTGISAEVLHQLISDQFAGKKSTEVAEINQRCAKAGFDYVVEHHEDVLQPFFSRYTSAAEDNPANFAPQLVMTGNEAFSLATVAADCKFYAAYPMTPTSAVLGILAAWQEQTGMVVRHSEDEIAVINSALGASFAGVRSAVGTSGGGFALMVEAVSMAGITETPVVILMGQRSGPATGMPTWTEQGDLLFTVNAGHGEFPKIVLAPGNLPEMIDMTLQAFDLADVYQIPVIILTDKFLAESHASVDKKFVEEKIKQMPNRGKLLSQWKAEEGLYLRYQDKPDGISPRLIPGTPGAFYQANSYEHLEDTHTTEDAAERIKQVDKRARKMKTYLESADFQLPILYTFDGNGVMTASNSNHAQSETPQLTLVGWGSTKTPCFAAMHDLAEKGIRVGYLHFSHVFPLSPDKVMPFFSGDLTSFLLVENNSTAQFGQLLRQQTGVHLTQQLLKYDGRPLFREEIVAKVKEILS